MFKNPITFTLFSALLSAPTFADIQIEYSNGEKTLISDQYAKLITEDSTSIFNLKTTELSVLFDPMNSAWIGTPKTFCEETKQFKADMQRQIAAAQEQMLQNYPKDQQEKMRAIMANTMSNKGPSQVDVQKLGDGEKILGYKTTRYELVVDGAPIEELWVSYDQKLLKEMNVFKKTAKDGDCADNEKEPEDFPAYDVIHNGVILKQIDLAMGESDKVATSIHFESIPAESFQLPKTYKVMSMNEIRQQAMKMIPADDY